MRLIRGYEHAGAQRWFVLRRNGRTDAVSTAVAQAYQGGWVQVPEAEPPRACPAYPVAFGHIVQVGCGKVWVAECAHTLQAHHSQRNLGETQLGSAHSRSGLGLHPDADCCMPRTLPRCRLPILRAEPWHRHSLLCWRSSSPRGDRHPRPMAGWASLFDTMSGRWSRQQYGRWHTAGPCVGLKQPAA